MKATLHAYLKMSSLSTVILSVTIDHCIHLHHGMRVFISITIGAPIVHMCHTKEIDTRTLTSTIKGRLRSISSVCVQQQERLVQFKRWALSMHVALIP